MEGHRSPSISRLTLSATAQRQPETSEVDQSLPMSVSPRPQDMLPTPPASLPTSFGALAQAGAASDARGPSDDADEPVNPWTEEAEEGLGGEREVTPPFRLDGIEGPLELDSSELDRMEVDVPSLASDQHELSGGGTAHHEPDAVANPFTTLPPSRSFRTRYASSTHSPTASVSLTTAAGEVAAPSADVHLPQQSKRVHAQISPASSVNNTPPSDFSSAFLPPTESLASLSTAQPASPDHVASPVPSPSSAPSLISSASFSYDAQRARPAAPLTTSSYASARPPTPPEVSSSRNGAVGLLRRRARSSTVETASSTNGETRESSSSTLGSGGREKEKDRTKRRRSGTLLSSFSAAISPTNPFGTSSSSTAGREASRTAEPVLSRTTSSAAAFPSTSFASSPGAGEPYPTPTLNRRRLARASSGGRLALVCLPGVGGTGIDERPLPSFSTPRPPTPALRSPPSLLRPRSPVARPIRPSPISEPQPAALSSSGAAAVENSDLAREEDSIPLFLSRAQRSVALQARGESLLREAENVLRRTDASLSTAQVLMATEQEGRTAEEGMADGTVPPSSTSSSPTSTSNAGSGSGSAARARQFLTQLRARRPRLSRNSSVASPPLSPSSSFAPFPTSLSHSHSQSLSEHAIPSPLPPVGPFTLRSLTLPSPPSLACDEWDERTEVEAAERLNRRLLERRRVSEELEAELQLEGSVVSPPTPPAAVPYRGPTGGSGQLEGRFGAMHSEPERVLFGEMTAGRDGDGVVGGGARWGDFSGGLGRMRLPTQASNALRRSGTLPTSSFSSSSVSAVTTNLAPSRGRLDSPSSSTDSTTTVNDASAPPRALVTPLAPITTVGPSNSERLATTEEEGTRHFWRTSPSPSPQSRRTQSLSLSSGLSSSLGGTLMRLPSRRSTTVRPGSGVPLFLGEEEEEEAEEGEVDQLRIAEEGRIRLGGWTQPGLSSLRRGLPSGSEGLRAVPRRWDGEGEGEEAEESWGSRRAVAGLEQDGEEVGRWGAEGRRPQSLLRQRDQPDIPTLARLPPFHFEERPTSASPAHVARDRGREGVSPDERDGSQSRSRILPWDVSLDSPPPSTSSRFNPFDDLPPALFSSSTFASRLPPAPSAAQARSSLAEALARLDAHSQSGLRPSSPGVETLRRRSPALVRGNAEHEGDSTSAPSAETAATTEADRVALHVNRLERLAALRRERNVVRSLLGSPSPPLPTGSPSHDPADRNASPAPPSLADRPPLSPGSRRRSLGGFLRTLSGNAVATANQRSGSRGLWESDDDFTAAAAGSGWGGPPGGGGFFGGLGGSRGWARGWHMGGFGGLGVGVGGDLRNYVDDDTFDTSYEALLRLSERLGDVKPKGVSNARLDKLPRFTYAEWPAPGRELGEGEKGKGREEVRLAEKGVDKEERCPVCLCDYNDDDEIMLADCSHGFHQECLTAWLKDHGSCPGIYDYVSRLGRRVLTASLSPAPQPIPTPVELLMRASAASLRARQIASYTVQLATRLPAASSLISTGHNFKWGDRTRVGQQEWQTGGRRGLFGIGEIVGVLTNPTEVLRSLADSKKLLDEARQELTEARERSQIPTSHTFSPLPGFFHRPNEIKAIERSLGSVPGFTVLFGASSVGKTALLRQVLSEDKYHVLHFDLRIAGFADLSSLYFSLSTQLESYFAAIPDLLGKEYGWGEFEKESWAFKHDRIEIQKRLKDGGEVKTSDVAHLLELFQSALLSYWNFQPMTAAQRNLAQEKAKQEQSDKKAGKSPNKDIGSKPDPKPKPKPKPDPTSSSSLGSNPSPSPSSHISLSPSDPTEARMRLGAVPEPKLEKDKGQTATGEDLITSRSLGEEEREKEEGGSKATSGRRQEEVEENAVDQDEPPKKLVPVFFIDEAHKLPALIQSEDAMKTFLDSMLVLTKQDRLCHVLHATSDPFYMHWLRQMNIMQHCQILSIGDTSKSEAHAYFEDVLLPHVPEKLRPKFDFENLYRVFGGKLAHLADYTGEFVNSDGAISPDDSSHFLQAHSLLNLQLIHSMPLRPSSSTEEAETEDPRASGFRIHSSLASASPHSAPSPFSAPSASEGPDFFPEDLLTVLRRLQPPSANSPGGKPGRTESTEGEEKEEGGQDSLPYFPLCRELGARAVDGMIRGRVLELRWSRAITEEGDLEEKRRRRDQGRREKGALEADREERRRVGPVVVPTTPVVRCAMGVVLREYEGEEEEAKKGKKVKGK
ncbi:hypothetical protein JCM11641_000392 [Rhodosporidiobolus odoratus]